MFKVKIIEWNRFNGYTIDRSRWTFINGKRVKNNEYYRINTNNLKHVKTKCYTEYKSKDIWNERGEMGWFGISSNDKDEKSWADEFKKFINNQKKSTIVTLVDCHT